MKTSKEMSDKTYSVLSEESLLNIINKIMEEASDNGQFWCVYDFSTGLQFSYEPRHNAAKKLEKLGYKIEPDGNRWIIRW